MHLREPSNEPPEVLTNIPRPRHKSWRYRPSRYYLQNSLHLRMVQGCTALAPPGNMRIWTNEHHISSLVDAIDMLSIMEKDPFQRETHAHGDSHRNIACTFLIGAVTIYEINKRPFQPQTEEIVCTSHSVFRKDMRCTASRPGTRVIPFHIPFRFA